jgi:hypothetical protein
MAASFDEIMAIAKMSNWELEGAMDEQARIIEENDPRYHSRHHHTYPNRRHNAELLWQYMYKELQRRKWEAYYQEQLAKRPKPKPTEVKEEKKESPEVAKALQGALERKCTVEDIVAALAKLRAE